MVEYYLDMVVVGGSIPLAPTKFNDVSYLKNGFPNLYIKKRTMELSAVLTPAPEGGYVAFNPETGTTTQGETIEEAITNLCEASELYLEEFPLDIIVRPLLTTFEVTKYA